MSCRTSTDTDEDGPGRIEYSVDGSTVTVREHLIPGDPSPGNALMAWHHTVGDSLEIFVYGNAHLSFKIHQFIGSHDHSLGKDAAQYESYVTQDASPGVFQITSIDTTAHRFDAIFHFVGSQSNGSSVLIESGKISRFQYFDAL